LSLFCAVAYSGTGNRVMTSPDGINWTTRSSAADNNWLSVYWSPELGLFCAVAYSGTGNRVMTSPDGINWTTRSSAADNIWYSVCWSPELGLFCAVASSGTNNRVMTSSLSGMRLYNTSTGYRLIVGADSPIQDRAALSEQYHHIGLTVRDVSGQQKWGFTVDGWSTEVNIAAHPIATGSSLHFHLQDGACIDDWAYITNSTNYQLTEMKDHAAVGQKWVGSAGIDTLKDLILTAKGDGTIWLGSEISGPGKTGWVKIADPPTGWLAIKTSGWTADQFTPGGLEVDFSSVVPVGTKAVRVNIVQLTVASYLFYRKSGDTNISNTPGASGEESHQIGWGGRRLMEIWLSSGYKAQFAVTDTGTDIYVAYPVEYLL